jgi:hypothetical protein
MRHGRRARRSTRRSRSSASCRTPGRSTGRGGTPLLLDSLNYFTLAPSPPRARLPCEEIAEALLFRAPHAFPCRADAHRAGRYMPQNPDVVATKSGGPGGEVRPRRPAVSPTLALLTKATAATGETYDHHHPQASWNSHVTREGVCAQVFVFHLSAHPLFPRDDAKAYHSILLRGGPPPRAHKK